MQVSVTVSAGGYLWHHGVLPDYSKTSCLSKSMKVRFFLAFLKECNIIKRVQKSNQKGTSYAERV